MTTSRRCQVGRQRGLVSIELALSTLVVLVVLAMVTWAMVLVMVQLACTDSASAVARQAARGDRAGVAAAEAAAPAHSTFRISRRDGQVEVTVRTRVQAPGSVLPTVTLRAAAQAVVEPGADR